MSEPSFLEGSAKIQVDKRMCTKFGQELHINLVILVDFSCFIYVVEYVSLVCHLAGSVAKVRPGVLVLDKDATCALQKPSIIVFGSSFSR